MFRNRNLVPHSFLFSPYISAWLHGHVVMKSGKEYIFGIFIALLHFLPGLQILSSSDLYSNDFLKIHHSTTENFMLVTSLRVAHSICYRCLTSAFPAQTWSLTYRRGTLSYLSCLHCNPSWERRAPVAPWSSGALWKCLHGQESSKQWVMLGQEEPTQKCRWPAPCAGASGGCSAFVVLSPCQPGVPLVSPRGCTRSRVWGWLWDEGCSQRFACDQVTPPAPPAVPSSSPCDLVKGTLLRTALLSLSTIGLCTLAVNASVYQWLSSSMNAQAKAIIYCWHLYDKDYFYK